MKLKSKNKSNLVQAVKGKLENGTSKAEKGTPSEGRRKFWSIFQPTPEESNLHTKRGRCAVKTEKDYSGVCFRERNANFYKRAGSGDGKCAIGQSDWAVRVSVRLENSSLVFPWLGPQGVKDTTAIRSSECKGISTTRAELPWEG